MNYVEMILRMNFPFLWSFADGWVAATCVIPEQLAEEIFMEKHHAYREFRCEDVEGIAGNHQPSTVVAVRYSDSQCMWLQLPDFADCGNGFTIQAASKPLQLLRL